MLAGSPPGGVLATVAAAYDVTHFLITTNGEDLIANLRKRAFFVYLGFALFDTCHYLINPEIPP
jgi:hypothetical protein